MELRLPLEMSPGREDACRAVFGTWGFFPNDARKNCPFVLTSFTGWSSERCPGIYFIDDAILLGISRVRILHGTGNGILRTLIRDYLSGVPGVANFKDEHVQFGGAGITVVDLD